MYVVYNGRKEKKPIITYIIMALCVLYFLIEETLGDSTNTQDLIRFGGCYLKGILDGEVYRLVTSVFMHIGIRHIVSNMLCLFIFGIVLEEAVGKFKYIIIYLVSGVGANIIDMMFEFVAIICGATSVSVGAGASGAIFGILGALLAVMGKNNGYYGGYTRSQIIWMIIFNLFFGLTGMQNVNNTVHICGLIIGYIMGLILYRKRRWRK